jgi:putative ABC transport system ATP-binding protein
MLLVSKLSKEYMVAGKQLPVLADIDLSIEAGSALSIIGPSGSGKSTLLYALSASTSTADVTRWMRI